jgi:hypothetical protein
LLKQDAGEQFELPASDLVHGSLFRVLWSRGDVPTLECDDLTPAPGGYSGDLTLHREASKVIFVVIRVNGKNILFTASGKNARKIYVCPSEPVRGSFLPELLIKCTQDVEIGWQLKRKSSSGRSVAGVAAENGNREGLAARKASIANSARRLWP